MTKFKSEIEMFGVDLKPKYAKTEYTVVRAAKGDIWAAQKLHRSYNREAKIHVYEKNEQGNWIHTKIVEVPKMEVAM